MFTKLKMKFAAKRMQRQKDFAAADKRIAKNDSAVKCAILKPFRMIGRALRWVCDTICAICAWVWEWICEINIVGLVNLTLLLAIIILFSMLIIDVTRDCRGRAIAVNNASANNVTVVATKYDGNKAGSMPLPNRRSNEKNSIVQDARVVRAAKPADVYGDLIIESRADAVVLKNGSHVRGNLYLQRMRKYVLPCGVVIDGNLFLRDVNLLQFCGPFAVKGNIYVSPSSSFGPIPYNARVGGQVIL